MEAIILGSFVMAVGPSVRATESAPMLGAERRLKTPPVSSTRLAERLRILGCHLPAPGPRTDRLHLGKISLFLPFSFLSTYKFWWKNDGLHRSPAIWKPAGDTALSPSSLGCCKATCPCSTHGSAPRPRRARSFLLGLCSHLASLHRAGRRGRDGLRGGAGQRRRVWRMDAAFPARTGLLVGLSKSQRDCGTAAVTIAPAPRSRARGKPLSGAQRGRCRCRGRSLHSREAPSPSTPCQVGRRTSCFQPDCSLQPWARFWVAGRCVLPP